ncbi:MAG TPA: hypothetical protein VNL77_21280 [Roseiflexaceae bacterium]|nr:hypothetical protein [Roseiflexaceae bacterium]
MSDQHAIGEILEQLRAEVRAQRLARGVAEQGPLERDLRRCLDEIELHRVVSAHWPLTARSLPGRALNLVHRLVRLGLRWYINPIVEQQNAYNDAVARALRLLSDAYLDLAEQIARTEAHGLRTTDPGNRGDGSPAADAPASAQPSSGADTAPAAAPQHATRSTQSLAALVAYAAASEPPARFPDLELRALAPALRARQAVSAHWPLSGRAVLLKRVVRQYLRWLINPIVEQQNAANAAIAAAIESAIRLDAERRAQVAGVRARHMADCRLQIAD